MTESRARVRFELENLPENVALVRVGLSALDGVFDFGDFLLNDLKTAASEACNNVVLHAYGGGHGPMSVTIECSASTVELRVVDHGSGLGPGDDGERIGLGLAVMTALADRIEFTSPEGGGAAVWMCFRRNKDSLEDLFAPTDQIEPAPIKLSGDAVIWFEPVGLLQPVFGRILRAVAASSNFSVDRVSELTAISNAFAAYAEYANGKNAMGVAITGAKRRLELTGGPFPDHGVGDVSLTERNVRRDELQRLVDGLTTSEIEGRETLQLVLIDHG